MSDSKHEGPMSETPDVSYIKNVDVAHEASDVQVRGIMNFVIALSVLIIGSCVLMWGTFRLFAARAKEPARSPMALSEKESLPPEPRLQGAPGFAEKLEPKQTKTEATTETAGERLPPPKDPLFEIRVLRDQWSDVLKNGPVDQNGKRYGMPIEEAKKKLIEQGLPARKQ